MFHSRTGSLVTLSNNNRTAQRLNPSQEFNNGLVMSNEPMKDDELFEVRIDTKVNSWSGSIEIGATTCDPNNLEFPTSAAELRNGSWIMSGRSVLKDGQSINEEYGRDLDRLTVGDRVGVMRTSQNELHFYVNGISQGVAASNIPSRVFAVVDMYGKCSQISTIEISTSQPSAELVSDEVCGETSNENPSATSQSPIAGSNITADRLHFHERCGFLVKLGNNNRAAERIRPTDEFNNAVVMTHRPIRDNELFEIRIDRLVTKWSGSIEVGVTTHHPATLEFPATMTNMRSGTIMMSGSGILTNGKGTRREYGEFNLDELTEGDHIGLMRKSNGNLHYYINGIDQGIAATKIPATVFGVVDLYGMTVKVTIVDRDDKNTQGLANHRSNTLLREFQILNSIAVAADEGSERLLFHPRCGSRAAVFGNGITAHRPNAANDFSNAVVLTNRPLKDNELFEVRLDRKVSRWEGSLEIGVTTHSPMDLEFPSTVTNMRSGTWIMSGSGVMHNGNTILLQYGQNLDRLKVGDHVGVTRMEDGVLHFFVNGIDQGAAANGVPEGVYGIVDLFGQAVQATIVDHSESTSGSSYSYSTASGSSLGELRFHYLHGCNAHISNQGMTASRPNAHGEFNDAIVIGNRALHDGEMFEVVIDKMVDRWSGSIECGVTAISPEDLEFPSTMTDINYNTWMLSGSAIMQDGSTIRNGYKCDLDALGVGSRIGMMRHSDATLHYYVNGEDQGMACVDIPSNIYPVIDLYGQCAQVTIVHPSAPRQVDAIVAIPDPTNVWPIHEGIDVCHCLSTLCGKNIVFHERNTVATRNHHYDHGIVFSSEPLRADELFEVRVTRVSRQWAGSLRFGLTTFPVGAEPQWPSPGHPLPPTAKLLSGTDTFIFVGAQVWKNETLVRDNYGPSLNRVDVGDCVGVKRCSDGTMHAVFNGEDLGVAAFNVPEKVFAVFDIYGSVESVAVISKTLVSEVVPTETLTGSHMSSQSLRSQDSLEHCKEAPAQQDAVVDFHDYKGRNVQLTNKNITAKRISGYNNGCVIFRRPMIHDRLFQVRIEKLDTKWSGSLRIGVTAARCDDIAPCLPDSAFKLKRPSWVICADGVFLDGTKIKGRYGPNLDSLQEKHVVGLLVDSENSLHLYVNGADQGVGAKDIPDHCYMVVDLSGQCIEVSIAPSEDSTTTEVSDSQREKADIENGLREKVSRPPCVNPCDVKNCEYQNMCSRFKTMLGLPDGYFNHDLSICYCETCYKIRGDEAYYKKGDPPKDYAVPFGWCQFMLRIPSKAQGSSVLDKWHIAFHGTRPGIVRKILDCGELLEDEDLLPNQRNMWRKNKAKDCDSESNLIYFSPTIRYATSSTFVQKSEFVDPETKKQFQAWIAFQLLVQPGAYDSGPERLGAREPIDGHFSNNDIEWFTKERRATVLHSLLIKLESVT